MDDYERYKQGARDIARGLGYAATGEPRMTPDSNPRRPRPRTGMMRGRNYSLTGVNGGDQRLLDIARMPADRRSALYGPATDEPAVDPYALLFEQSRSAARAGIDAQIAAAMGNISARESAAQEMAGGLPAQIQALYAQGASGLGNAVASLDAAQQASGLTSFMGAEAQMAPLQGAIQMDQTARLADVPLLKQAIAGQASAERGALNQRRMELETELNRERESRMFDLLMREDDEKRRRDERLENRQWSLQDARLQRAWQMGDARAAAEMERDPETDLTRAEIESTRSSSAYKYVLARMRGEAKSEPLSPEEIVQKYRGNPTLLKVLAKDIPGVAEALFVVAPEIGF